MVWKAETFVKASSCSVDSILCKSRSPGEEEGVAHEMLNFDIETKREDLKKIQKDGLLFVCGEVWNSFRRKYILLTHTNVLNEFDSKIVLAIVSKMRDGASEPLVFIIQIIIIE